MGDGKWDDDEFSVIGEKGEIGFIDYQDDQSVCCYNPVEESPIVISVPFPFVDGRPKSVFLGETATDMITITNTTDEAVDLWTKIYASTPENSFTLSLMEPPKANGGNSSGGFVECYTLEDRMLQPKETLNVWLNCKPKEIGLYTSVVHVDAENERIERVVFLLAEDKISRSLVSKRPYSRTARKKKEFTVKTFVAGSRPLRAVGRPPKNRLPRYDIPKESRELIENKRIPDFIEEGLTRGNYSSYFKTLLMMEEIQMEEDMSVYDMEGAMMRKMRGDFLALTVLGLAERRPSLVHGDFIFARLANSGEGSPSYQGFVHRVEADEVYLKFAPEFHSNFNGDLYDIHFTYNRLNMRRQYQAIDATEDLKMEFLFPSERSESRIIETTTLVPITYNLNEEQICSIEMILGCQGGPPYVIYGPPGTGKTMTIVEAILQLYRNRADTRILVCAPSNSAADHLMEKLLRENTINIRENEIFRLNATSRTLDDIKPEYKRFCFFDEFIFKCPPLFALVRYRIIISTYMSASLLFGEGIEPGHFSHIFLDEAAQASEPESMIPISNLSQGNTVVVLAGDPMQLGPVIYSRLAEGHGLGKSFLERLSECEYYNNGDENYVTKLVRNYRCHPDILSLPSNLFYGGELIASKEDTDDTNSILSLVNLLPGRNFPVLFFGVQGCDEREGNNPSWFNRIEASKVVDIINKLVCAGDINEADIGVITPYKQQVLKLKKVLDDMDMPDIKVGSVEQFQGQERKVIIVSTVRSTIKHNEFDSRHCLGFLSNPKRFNVAITRPIALLIIIGNPHIISKDQYWNQLLWYCVDNDSYQGCGLPERQDPIDEYQMQEDCVNYEENGQPSQDGGWGEENAQPSQDGGCGEESCQPEIPKPVDEAEWSDGWK